MKNFLKISLVTVLLFTGFGAFADEENFALKTTGKNEKSVVFQITETQDLKVSIEDTNLEVIYEKELHAVRGSKKTYDLSAFPDGNYTFKLETETSLTIYPISIEAGKAVVAIPVTKEFFKPILKKEAQIITLNLDTILAEAFEIEIVNEKDELVYQKVFTGKTQLVKSFDISKTNARELTFKVTSKNKEFSQTIALY